MSEEEKVEVEEVVVEEKPEVDEEAVKEAAKAFLAYVKEGMKEETPKEADPVKSMLYGSKSVEQLSKEEKTGEFIKAVLQNDRVKLQPLTEGTAANGGSLVPAEWNDEIIQNINDISVVRPNATVIPMTTDTMTIVQQSSQPRVGWRSELAAKQTTTASFAEISLTPYSLAAIVVLSQELVDDAQVGLPNGIVNWVTAQVVEQISLAEDTAFLDGSGTGQPTGILAAGYTAIRTVNAAKALTGDHLINQYYKLVPADRQKAIWVMSSATVATVRALKSTTNQYLFNDALTASGFPTLLGKPVYETDAVGPDIICGNFKAYYIGDRTSRSGGRISVRVSDEAYVGGSSMFERNEVAIRVEERTDGEVTRQQAFVTITNAI